MNLLLYSSFFYPSTGGIETISATLAENLTQLGVSVTIVTETPENEKVKNFPYAVIRKPNLVNRLRLIRQSDVVHSNGASLALFFFAKLFNKPFIWTHNGYQLLCVDGLGWVDGEKAPLSPKASLQFHFRRKGLLFVVKEFLKLYLRRIVSHYVTVNVAATGWVASRQPLKNQVILYTPYPLERFKVLPNVETSYDFIFVGRLVSEKGVDTLLQAFQLLTQEPNHTHRTLLIVGDGVWKRHLENIAIALGIAEQVTFVGKKTGHELLENIAKAPIAIVPSAWEEPMGGVALELLAAQRSLIISSRGGMKECIGEAGLIFENGNAEELRYCMKTLFEDKQLRDFQQQQSVKQLEKFDELTLTKMYMNLYMGYLHK
jgi:glycosyltransferase involved in cell wall biosynthesis